MTRLADAFAAQAESCTALGSPFMGRLMMLFAQRWPETGVVARAALEWPGDLGPKAASLPLRIAGGLHALVLSGRAPDLVRLYPPNHADDVALWSGVSAALIHHETFLREWINSPPQTNEVRRAAALIPPAHMLAARFGLPLRLSELGASGGLNLKLDGFQLTAAGKQFGPASDVALAPDWTGPVPNPSEMTVAERRGVDLNPLDPTRADGALRLMAYLWPDQADRLARTRAAIALPPAPVDAGAAIDWLAQRLRPQPGQCHLVYTTIAWQYFSPQEQTRGLEHLAEAGRAATDEAPLAFLTMEADGAAAGAALRMRVWPGDLTLDLARIDFHGRWVRWTGPTALP